MTNADKFKTVFGMYHCRRVCDNKTDLGYCRTTVCIYPEHIPSMHQTNADRIRQMTDEELAEFIEGAICPPKCYSRSIGECEKEECVPCWLKWLREEVKE